MNVFLIVRLLEVAAEYVKRTLDNLLLIESVLKIFCCSGSALFPDYRGLRCVFWRILILDIAVLSAEPRSEVVVFGPPGSAMPFRCKHVQS